MNPQARFRDDVLYLGTKYFEVIRSGLRRDIAQASTFFGIPEGQLGYVIGSISQQRLAELASLGMPYQVPGPDSFAVSGARTMRSSKGPLDQGLMVDWQKKALDLANDHWWIARDWARESPGLAALQFGVGTNKEMQLIADLPSRDIRELAELTYDKLIMEGSMAMQMSFLFADAEASPDRVAVARAGCLLLAA